MSDSTESHSRSRSDPLSTLGASLFLQVLSELPLRSLLTCTTVCKSWKSCIQSSTATLYRPLAHSLGVEKKDLKTLEQLERAFAKPSSWSITSGSSDFSGGYDPEETGPEPEPEPEPENGQSGGGDAFGSVDWKGVVKAWVILQGNWRQARAKGSWITPGRNTVWRLKVDQEEKTIITTSRLDGVLVSDAETSDPLFEYTDVAPYAHLEFAKGFVIFNIGNDHVHEVHVTPSAYARLSPTKKASLPPFNRSLTHNTAYSFTPSDDYTPPRPSADNPTPPRGHLTYYRTIRPPTECFAFRARVDKADTEGERAVLGTAGAQGAYIFDLEDGSKMERYAFTEPETRRPNYIEFDDDYLFICGNTQVHIYSRLTKRKIISFPPASPSSTTITTPASSSNNRHDSASAIYTLNAENGWQTCGRGRYQGAVGVAKADIPGKWLGDAGFEEAKSGIRIREFTACHYTSTDLFATTHSGCLYVLRNYAEILAIEDLTKREKAAREHTLVVVFGHPLKQLSTFGEHVVLSSPEKIFLLDTSSLPKPPYNDPVFPTPIRPTLRIHQLKDTHPRGMSQSSCLQVDREKIYTTYWALGEFEAGEWINNDNDDDDDGIGQRIAPTEEALNDFGLCIKVWDFGLRPGQV
ncbi:hypothetical protein IAT40_000610 [Kwoniella sp. CBS 6097]